MDNSGFIDSVHKNVIAHITDENFGVGDLASLLGLSTSHTLRKVKAATGKSVNQYIREVRLAEAAKLIKETDFTSAEIAYKVGFSSPSYFNRTFRKRYGITPGEYKTQEISLTKLDSKDIPSVISINKVLNILAISMLLLIGFLIINNAVSKANSKQISIAVLPFKDMSPIESQWFCDGVVEDILSHLSKINELRVISRTSTMQYRDTKKTIPEIAKELKVDYILEGSARQHQNKVVITAQLINAKDEHLWAEDYNENWDNIFKIQKDVAIKIVEELQINHLWAL